MQVTNVPVNSCLTWGNDVLAYQGCALYFSPHESASRCTLLAHTHPSIHHAYVCIHNPYRKKNGGMNHLVHVGMIYMHDKRF